MKIATKVQAKIFDKVLYLFFLILMMFSIYCIYLAWDLPAIADDYLHFLNNSLLSKPIDWKAMLGPSWDKSGLLWGYRPLYYLTFWLENKIFGYQLGPLRVLNFILHIMNILLAISLFKKINGPPKKIIYFGLFVLLLFHPVAWHSILYASARSTILVSVFILLCLLAVTLDKKKRILAFPFALFAFLSKQTGLLAIPLGLAVYMNRQESSLRQHILMVKDRVLSISLLGFGLLAFCYLQWQTLAKFYDQVIIKNNSLYDYPTYLMTQIFVILKSFLHMIFPYYWAFYYHTSLIKSSLHWTFWLSFFLLIIVFLLILKNRKKKSSLFFLLGAGCFLPELFYPRELISNEQRMYLPLIFFVLSLMAWASEKDFKKESMLAFVLLAVSFFANLTFARLHQYSDIEGLMKHDIAIDPENANAFLMLGQINEDKKQLNQAYFYFKKSMSLLKKDMWLSPYLAENYGKAMYKTTHIGLMIGKVIEVKESLKVCHENLVPKSYCQMSMATLAIQQKDYDKVFSIYETNTEFSIAELQIMARAAILNKQPQKSLELIRYINDHGHYDEFTFMLEARAHSEMGHLEKAISAARRGELFYQHIAPNVAKKFRDLQINFKK